MTNQYFLERPKVRAKVKALLLDGKRPSEIAELVSTPKQRISRQAVHGFIKRHEAEIAPLIKRLEREIEDYALAQKVRRIAGADSDYQRLGQVIEARAGDERWQNEPGYSTGLMVHQTKMIGTGKDAEVVDEFKVDTAVIAERRALRNEVATELGQLPKGDSLNIDNRTQVLIRQYSGFDINALD